MRPRRLGFHGQLVAVATLVLVMPHATGCGIGPKAHRHQLHNPLVGTWETDPTLSQLGTIVTRFDFGADGRYLCEVRFLDADLPPEVTGGTYEIRGENVIMTTVDNRTAATFSFEQGVLVLVEGTEKFRMRRK